MSNQNEKNFIEKMVVVFNEINTLTEDLNEIKTDSKEAGFDSTKLATIAKAKADGALGKLRTKLESTLDIMDKAEEE
jgi:uncharacterized protein (UPF0335 family)